MTILSMSRSGKGKEEPFWEYALRDLIRNAVTLAFTGLRSPDAVAVDAIGDVYVTDFSNNRVLELRADATR